MVARRIIIIGNGASGKTWLAGHLARLTGYPLWHLDRQIWRPGWVMTPPDQVVAWLQDVMSGDSWIIEGEHDATTEQRFAAADAVIVMDMNRLLCLWRVLRRAGSRRPDLPDGMREPRAFSHGFFHYCRHIWHYQDWGRPTALRLHASWPDVQFYHVRSKRQAAVLLDGGLGASADVATRAA